MDIEENSSEEEQYRHPPHPQLELKLQKEAQYQCQTLVIGQSGPSTLFLHSLIGQLNISNRVNFSKAKQSSLADLYVDGQTAYLAFNDEMPPMKEIFFARFLEKNIKFSRLMLVMSVSRNTLEDTNCPNLTCVTTSNSESSLPKFTEGITGIWAELIAWGQLNRIPVTGFMVAMKEYELTSDIIGECFGGLRGKYGLKDANCKIGEKVRKYNIKKASNKLYL